MRRISALALSTAFAFAGPSVLTSTADAASARGCQDPVSGSRIHDRIGRGRVHRCRYERRWVPPVYRTVCVGYDRCGNPIYDRVLVRCGYWTRVRICGCGCG